jgi:hypothetical protein
MEQDHPVTRREFDAGLANFKTELKTELKAEMTELKTELKNELVEMMRDIETNLLTAFHGYSRSNGVRLSGMEVTDRELRLRMDELETRMLNLELRRPPAA